MNAERAPEWREARGRGNNFDTLRTVAAVAVLVSHAFPIAHGAHPPQPLADFSHHQTALGSIAVLVFFVISGYLITRSFDRNPSPLCFLQARALRIFPGLFVALVSTAAVLGAAVTALPLDRYYAHPDTAQYVYGGLSLRGVQQDLPGVFEANHFRTVNGSLWTLQYEFELYLLVLALGVCRLLNRWAVLALWVVALALSSLGRFGGDHVQFAAPFLGGAALYLWRDRMPLDGRLALVCAAVLTAAMPVGGFRPAFATFGAYLVVYLAVAPAVRLPNLARRGDLSYGIYVFAWPVQQTAALLLGLAAGWYWNVAVSLPLVLALAWLSWRFVEEPALRLKHLHLPTADLYTWVRARAYRLSRSVRGAAGPAANRSAPPLAAQSREPTWAAEGGLFLEGTAAVHRTADAAPASWHPTRLAERHPRRRPAPVVPQWSAAGRELAWAAEGGLFLDPA